MSTSSTLVARLCALLCTLAVFGGVLPAAWAQARADYSDHYLSAYLVMQDGEKLELRSQFDAAYRKYVEASQMFTSIADQGWKPEMVNYRRRMLDEAMKRITPKLSKNPGGLAKGYTRDDARARPSTNPTPRRPDQLYQDKDTQIKRLASENTRLANELSRREADVKRARFDLDQARNQQQSLRNQLARAQGRLGAGGIGGDAAVEQEIAELQKQIAQAETHRLAAEKQTRDYLGELENANSLITSLRSERDELVRERNQMRSLLRGAASGEMQRLLDENKRLRSELSSAQNQSKKIDAANKQEIAQLKSQIGRVNEQLTALKAENDQYRKQIEELSGKLRSTSDQLVKAIEKSREGADPILLEENETLRRIIVRQLKQQARRQQAKQLVMAEISRMGDASGDLLANLDRMGGTFQLTETERQIFQDPKFQDLMQGAIFAENTGTKAPEYPDINNNDGDKTALGLNHDLTQFAKAAAWDFRQGNFDKCESSYQRILDIAPQNIYSLRNLGIVKMRLSKATEAEELFKKAIAYDSEDDYSQFILGVLYFKQARLDDAARALEKTIKINPKNAKAYGYLGYMSIGAGAHDQALNEFQQAVSIDPGLADAHFNLAYLYLTQNPPQRRLAKDHYRKALRNGAEPDDAIERRIGG